jgi:hypothetical protein
MELNWIGLVNRAMSLRVNRIEVADRLRNPSAQNSTQTIVEIGLDFEITPGRMWPRALAAPLHGSNPLGKLATRPRRGTSTALCPAWQEEP